jgi:hypothetical protein
MLSKGTGNTSIDFSTTIPLIDSAVLPQPSKDI